MKLAFICLFSMIGNVLAQDPNAYIKNFESKIYSLKSKGVKDFVVDIESSKITKQVNEQQVFGKVDNLIFRLYWTAVPERMSIEVIGLPEGFKEVKEELKASIIPILDHFMPQSFAQKFTGYKFVQGTNQREILAQDTTGIAPIPSFSLKFDPSDKLVEVIGNKAIGSLTVSPKYSKEVFADGKWVLTEETTNSSEGGYTLSVRKILNYAKANGIGVLEDVEITTDQKFQSPEVKPVKSSETVTFKKYQINEGRALKFFLGETKSNQISE
jgi:hypothetical protein